MDPIFCLVNVKLNAVHFFFCLTYNHYINAHFLCAAPFIYFFFFISPLVHAKSCEQAKSQANNKLS